MAARRRAARRRRVSAAEQETREALEGMLARAREILSSPQYDEHGWPGVRAIAGQAEQRATRLLAHLDSVPSDDAAAWAAILMALLVGLRDGLIQGFPIGYHADRKRALAEAARAIEEARRRELEPDAERVRKARAAGARSNENKTPKITREEADSYLRECRKKNPGISWTSACKYVAKKFPQDHPDRFTGKKPSLTGKRVGQVASVKWDLRSRRK